MLARRDRLDPPPTYKKSPPSSGRAVLWKPPGVDVTTPRSTGGRAAGFGRHPASPAEYEAGVRDALRRLSSEMRVVEHGLNLTEGAEPLGDTVRSLQSAVTGSVQALSALAGVPEGDNVMGGIARLVNKLDDVASVVPNQQANANYIQGGIALIRTPPRLEHLGNTQACVQLLSPGKCMPAAKLKGRVGGKIFVEVTKALVGPLSADWVVDATPALFSPLTFAVLSEVCLVGYGRCRIHASTPSANSTAGIARLLDWIFGSVRPPLGRGDLPASWTSIGGPSWRCSQSYLPS
ncbi:hypothetical protein THAOC_22513 [Thalassiosira oceanica]|uniref:Uncharacterized protein n=1 Tax=Thalassiosira oceanica TaxID=159749 RepID=K0SFM7_THAOC|nr:hypothetical protein THAOC_22513 [Thalassiosira oceanica]|eukprot:EJK57437.1 hypothetical protein THAOC_22513 [Thalassiosira oceanica]